MSVPLHIQFNTHQCKLHSMNEIISSQFGMSINPIISMLLIQYLRLCCVICPRCDDALL